MRPQPPDAALRLAAIVESSSDAILSVDLDGVVTSWNRGAQLLFGYEPHEMVGHKLTLLAPPDRAHEAALALSRVLQGQVVPPFDTVRWRKDGTLVDVSVTVSPIRDHDGVIVGASKISRDISERRRMELELRESQRRLMGLAVAASSVVGATDVDSVLGAVIEVARDVFEADGYAIWRVDQGGRWRVVRSHGISERFATRVIETSPTSPVRRLNFETPIVCPDVATAPMVAHLRDEYEREGIASMVVFPLTIHGERCATMVFYSRHRREYPDADVRVGSAVANLAAAALTTAELYEEQRKAREAADHARRQAAFLADAGTALSASLDYESTLTAVSRLAVPTLADWCAVDVVDEHGILQRLAVAHVDPDKVALAKRLHERYPPDPNAPGGVYEVIRTGIPVLHSPIPTALLDAAAKDDEHRRLIAELQLKAFLCVPMLAQGTALGAISFVSAESGREYSDADLRVASELATRAALAVQNARAYARANEASRLKDDFLATLSHELRTPLNAVLGYIRMLRSGMVTPERTATALETVERNATALQQIIEDVLDVSRIVAGRLRLAVQAVDLPSILRESRATVTPAADAKGVRIEMIVDPSLPPVPGDPDRLQQIVWNLLSNAIKFTPRGGKVQLRLSRVSSHVEIVVADTGAGIAADFLPHVFERFRQADATFTREHGGLGLGLAIAKQLTELHGGTISAASDGPGTGATFTVALPLMIVHGSEHVVVRRAATPPTLAPVAERPRLDGLHVLAVDDERDSLSLLRAVIESAGGRVTTATSVAEALERIRLDLPDALICDIGMPGTDGYGLIRALRRMEEPARSLPAAALTAYARTEDRITSLASGFQMHLVKPIDPLELLVAISTLAVRRYS
jgi:PAS domain S-box-containing protein